MDWGPMSVNISVIKTNTCLISESCYLVTVIITAKSVSFSTKHTWSQNNYKIMTITAFPASSVFITTKQGMMKQLEEMLFSAECMSIRRCHTLMLFLVRFPYSSVFSNKMTALKKNKQTKKKCKHQIIRPTRHLKSENTKIVLLFPSFVFWLLGRHLTRNIYTVCSLRTIST